jgi:hypothetical protein
MNTSHMLHEEITVALCVWVLFLIALVASAACKSRAAPRANAPASSERTNVAETMCGPPAETLALSQPALPSSRTPEPSNPATVAKPRKSIPGEVAVTGPYEFSERL